jgi:hypothetical protein
MELHQARYFLAVCNDLNFTRAAGRCNVSQPSLNRRSKREDFSAVARPVIEEIGVACQLVVCAKNNIVISCIVSDLTVIVAGNAECPCLA